MRRSGRRARARMHHADRVRRWRSSTEPAPTSILGELALHWRLATVSVDKAEGGRRTQLRAGAAGARAGWRLAEAAAAVRRTRSSCSAAARDGRQRCQALIGLGEAQRLIGERCFPRDAPWRHHGSPRCSGTRG